MQADAMDGNKRFYSEVLRHWSSNNQRCSSGMGNLRSQALPSAAMAAKLRTTCSILFKFPAVAEAAAALVEELAGKEELQLELELDEEDQDEEDEDQVLDDEDDQVDEDVVEVDDQVVEGGGDQVEEGGVQVDDGVVDELDA